MRFALHAGPSSAAWAWANQIVSEAVSNGWTVVDCDSAGMTLLGRPDWVLYKTGDLEADEDKGAVIFGPDFSAADLGRMNASQLADHFHSQSLPGVDGTRWFAGAYVTAAASPSLSLIDSAAQVFEISGFGVMRRPVDLGELRVADPALGIYRDVLVVGDRAFWSSLLFARQGQDASQANAWLDVTGRARLVAEDPWMSLLPGRWSIEWIVEVDPEGGFLEFLFQWGDQEFIKSINRPGRYSVTQSANWVIGGHAPARIVSSRPHFQGRIKFMGAVVNFLGSCPSEAPVIEEPLQER